MSRDESKPGRTALLCMGAGAVNAFWLLGLRSWLPGWAGLPSTPLTTGLFLAGAALARPAVKPRYRWGVVAGLGFSALGDAFLMQARDFFLLGLTSFLVGHLCYLWALTADTGFGARKLPFMLYGLLGVVLVLWLWPTVPPALRLPVVLYAATLLTMAAQAATRALARPAVGAHLAAAGAALFVVSDAALAARRFGHPLPQGHLLVLGTYFAAQAGLALSAVFGEAQPPTK